MTTEEKINKAKGAVKEGLGKLVGDKQLEKGCYRENSCKT